MINASSLNWLKNGDGLLPAIIQDADTAQVLMLGYMNLPALQQTLQTGFVTFFSRSKKRLWQKGETSGNGLMLCAIAADCDGDALLIRARPQGPVCHAGTPTCFTADEIPMETIGVLSRTIMCRASGDDMSSYTKQLLLGGVDSCGAKVLEEAEEVVRAAREEGKQRTIEEGADLLYHLLVLLQSQEIDLSAIAEELRKRRR